MFTVFISTFKTKKWNSIQCCAVEALKVASVKRFIASFLKFFAVINVLWLHLSPNFPQLPKRLQRKKFRKEAMQQRFTLAILKTFLFSGTIYVAKSRNIVFAFTYASESLALLYVDFSMNSCRVDGNEAVKRQMIHRFNYTEALKASSLQFVNEY